jgi:hypothetical protein
MRYWARIAGEVQGPFTLEQLAAQSAPDATLVCPEGRPRNRRGNWLPLRKAKAPAIFYVRVGSKIRGPFAGAELSRLSGFCGDTLVCPERRNCRNRWSWAPARTFAALRPAQSEPAPAPAASAAAAAPGGPQRSWEGLSARWRQPPVLPLVMVTAAIITGVLLWMKFSYLPRVRQTYQRVHTSMGLMVLAAAQERYRKEYGAYAPDLDSLTDAAGPWLPELLAENLDLQTLLVRGTSSHFRLEANALDDRRTLVHFEASASGRSAVALSSHTVSAKIP